MLRRRGFTLLELMVGIVLLGIVGLMMARLMTSMLRVTTAQIQVAGAQGTARMGVSGIPLEFREIGFDTLTKSGKTDSDLEAIAIHKITFRAMRGMGTTCDISVGGDAFKIRLPLFGLREPQLTDSFRIFVENDINLGTDDNWVSLKVTDIEDSDCGPDKALLLTVTRPQYDDGSGDIPLSQIFVGGPIRWYERMEYAPVVDGTTGRMFVGARSLNLGENTLEPMIGPIPDSTGFTLTYYGGDGTVLDPTAASNRIKVRSIGINVTGSTTAPVSLGGGSDRARGSTPVFTRVALRNNLRENAP